MKNSFMALLLAAPLFGALGSMVVTNRMAFFSDALGHGAFTGVALGAIGNLFIGPTWAAVLFSVGFAIIITLVKRRTRTSSDTVIGVFSSLAVALGILLLSQQGSLASYSSSLTGDILSVTPTELSYLALLFIVVMLIWIKYFNDFILIGLDGSLARSSGFNPLHLEILFTTMLATLVSLSLSWIGLLLINSFLVLPAATARLLSRNLRQYHNLAVLFAVVCALLGLYLSDVLSLATSATIVLLQVLAYIFALLIRTILLNRLLK
jgi:zinc transport system permease protein